MPTNYKGYVVPVDADVADAPKAFTDFTDSIPFSDFVEVVEVTAATRTVEDADNGKMLFVKTNSTLTFGTLTDGFSAAVVADTGVTVTFAGVDAEGATTSAYEVATVVAVNGTNVLTLPGADADCPDCPECPECPEPILPGVGGWANLTAVSGTYTKNEYTDSEGDWCVYVWTDDGTVTTTDGLVDILIVAGGAGTSGDGSIRGSGGGVMTGVKEFDGGELSVVVGIGGDDSGTAPSGMGYYSQIGDTTRIGGGTRGDSPNGYQRGNNGSGYYAGAGSAGNGEGRTTGGIGVTTSLINGNPVMYASGGGDYRAAEDDRPGDGGHGDGQPSAGYGMPGVQGIVAVRVPQEYADSVSESYNTWLSYATVEDGVVTQVNKVADNGAYTAATDQIPCDPRVKVGYLYEDGEFVAPETEDE